MRVATALVLVSVLACLSVVASKEYENVKDVPFSVVKNQPAQRLVVFYFGSDEASGPVLDVVDQTAEYLTSLDLAKLKTFQYAKVDCESEENKPDCDEAGFKNPGIWIFTSTPHEGIQAYSGSRDTPSLSNHIRHKFLPYDEADVLPFESENALFERMDKSERDPPKPIIVKFWESWCTHCKQLKLPYDQAATFFKDQVEFMECECSKNDQTKAFCNSQGIKSYPTLILFDGENKHTWDMPDKSVTSFQNFFLSKLPEDRYTKVEDKEAAGLPPPPGVAAVSDKPRPAPGSSTGSKKDEAGESKKTAKKSKKRSDDDDEEEEKPKKKSKKSKKRRDDDDEDEDEEPRRRRRSSRRRRRRDDDDDEDDEPRRRRSRRSRRRDDDDDDEDEKPKKKSKKAKKSKRDEDDEEEEEAPKKTKKAKKAPVHDEL